MSVFFLVVASAAATRAQTIQSCKVESEDALYTSIRKAMLDAINTRVDEFDFRSAVKGEWDQLRLTDSIREAANLAGDAYGGDYFFERQLNRRCTSYTSRCAEDAAKMIAGETFSTPNVRDGIARIITNTIDSFIGSLEDPLNELEDNVRICLKEYVEANYAQVVALDFDRAFQEGVVENRIKKDLTEQIVPGQRSPYIIGAGAFLILLRKQIAKRVAKGISTKILGKLASRAIPFLGWALLGAEVMFGGDGSIPAIVKELSAPRTVSNVQANIARDIKDGLGKEADTLADDFAKTIMESWRAYIREHEQILGLIKNNPRFREYMKQYGPGDQAVLINVQKAVAFILTVEGNEAINRYLDKGNLLEVNTLTPEGKEIAQTIGSIRQALGWQKLARRPSTGVSRLPEILATRVFKHFTPDDLTYKELDFLLLLKNERDIIKLSDLTGQERFQVADMDPQAAVNLVRTVSAETLPKALEFINAIQAPEAQKTVIKGLKWGRYSSEELVSKLERVANSNDQVRTAKELFRPAETVQDNSGNKVAAGSFGILSLLAIALGIYGFAQWGRRRGNGRTG